MKKPHIELSIHGENVGELIAWIRKKYDVEVLVEESESELISIESTDYWKEMEKNRVGNLRQNMVSDYERGRRTYSDAMARRLSKTLKVKEEYLRY